MQHMGFECLLKYDYNSEGVTNCISLMENASFVFPSISPQLLPSRVLSRAFSHSLSVMVCSMITGSIYGQW